jgi:ATP-binding cassette subfamily B multidrug efflux pump
VTPLLHPLLVRSDFPLRSSARRTFVAYVRRYWSSYLFGALAIFTTNCTEIFFPKCIQWIIDLLSGLPIPAWLIADSREHTFFVLCGLSLLVWLIQGVSRRYWRLMFGKETNRSDGLMRSVLWRHVKMLPLERTMTELTPGAMMNVAAGDTRVARVLLGWSQVALFDVVFLIIMSVAAMAYIDISLTLTSLIVSPILVLVSRFYQKKEYQAHDRAQDALKKFNELCSEALGSIRLQRVTVTESSVIRHLKEAAHNYGEVRREVLGIVFTLFPILGAAPLFSYGVILFLGIDHVTQGTITAGELVALLSYALLLQGPIGQVSFIIGDIQRGLSSLDRINGVLHEQQAREVLQKGALTLANTQEALSLKHVSLEREGRVILGPLSCSIKRGERVGITGRIGSGKSTLVNLIAGVLAPSSGSIALYGTPLEQLSREAVTQTVIVVPQRTFLFRSSLRENLLLDTFASDQQLWDILEVVQIADELRKIPGGLDGNLHEWGVNLSGGQRQRISIARALVKLVYGKGDLSEKILILDDCLSAVDRATEHVIVEKLNALLKECTVVWIAHRASTLRHCDWSITLGLNTRLDAHGEVNYE